MEAAGTADSDGARGGRTGSTTSSVFSTPDQDDMIARLDAVQDDDLDSEFFDASVHDAADAAVGIFDIGIRTLAAGEQADDHASASPFQPSARPSQRVSSATTSPLAARAEPAGRRGADFTDPEVRAAFILGGPSALA